jgi:hypothetical protein
MVVLFDAVREVFVSHVVKERFDSLLRFDGQTLTGLN